MNVVVTFHRNHLCSFREEVASICRQTDDALSHKLPGTTFQVSERQTLDHSMMMAMSCLILTKATRVLLQLCYLKATCRLYLELTSHIIQCVTNDKIPSLGEK